MLKEAENSKILKKIIALMERNQKNGATKHEAETALEIANRLMAKYDVTELDLKKVDRSSFTDKPFKMTRLAVLNLLTELAKAFDCEHYYYRAVKEFHFFGFEIDVKMCLYFADMLQSILELDIKDYKKTDKYKKLVSIYQPKIIIRSFISGFYYSLAKRFKEMKEEKQIISSGTSLIVIKKQQIQNEFQQRFGKIKTTKNPEPHLISSVFSAGEDNAKKIQLNKPLNHIEFLKLEGQV